MENNESTTTEAPARSVPVMDVQPPKVTDVEATAGANPEVAAPAVESAPAEPVATAPAEPAVAPEEAPAVPATDVNNPMAITPANAGAAKHKAPVGAIVAAILLALLLAAATVYAYTRTKQTAVAPKTNNTATTNKSQSETPTQTAGDVQQAADNVDSSLKSIDENKDFSSTDLSDTSLGL